MTNAEPEIKARVRKMTLTDRALKAATKTAAAGTRPTLWDALVPGFGARVSETGKISFVVMKRLGSKVVRHKLGDYGADDSGGSARRGALGS